MLTSTDFVFIKNGNVPISTSAMIGEGGEAEVYNIGDGQILKLYKQPSHPAFADPTLANARQATEQRLALLQSKLAKFPAMHPNVVAPDELAYADSSKRVVVGYTAKLIEDAIDLRTFSQLYFKNKQSVTDQDVFKVFSRLHEVVSHVHAAGVVIGDFNPLNVLIKGAEPFLIDSDSMQFGSFPCMTFTTRYVDPLLCMINPNVVLLNENYGAENDWYAFAILLWEALLSVHPYGGVFKPSPGRTRLGPEQRILKRVSVFDPDVAYPTAARHYSTLPAPLLDFYRQLLTADYRAPFPLNLLSIGTTTPNGVQVGTTALTTRAPGTRCRTIFETSGTIRKVVQQNARLAYVYHQDGTYFRESNRKIMAGDLDPAIQFAIRGQETIATMNGVSMIFRENGTRQRLNTNSYRNTLAVLDASAEELFWCEQGVLLCERGGAQKVVCEVIPNQTRIWAGRQFGIGLTDVRGIRRAFVFNAAATKIPIDLPWTPAPIINARCEFGACVAWVFLSLRETSGIRHYCFAVNERGDLLAQHTSMDGDDDWLENIDGLCAAPVQGTAHEIHDVLMASTAGGIAEIGIQKGAMQVRKIYAGAEQFAAPGQPLVFCNEGLAVVERQRINLITTL